MRKRWLSILCALALVLSLAPAPVFAAEISSLTVNGADVAVDRTGYYELTDTGLSARQDAEPASGEYVYFDANAQELTLHNVTITATDYFRNGIFVEGALTVVLEGTNEIHYNADLPIGYGIYATGELWIEGTGSLSAQTLVRGLWSGETVYVNGTEFENINCNNLFIEDGQIIAKEVVTSLEVGDVTLVENGEETGSSVPGVSYDASTNTLTLTDATITSQQVYSCGIDTNGGLTIQLEGDNVITTSVGGDFGIISSYGSLVLEGTGTLTITGFDTGVGAYGDITIADSISKLEIWGSQTALDGDDIIVGSQANPEGLNNKHVVIEEGVVTQGETLLTELWVNGENLLDGGTVAGATYDADTNTLTLENVTIDTMNGEDAGIYADDGLIIELVGDNVITGSASSDMYRGIFVDKGGSLTLQGTGTLAITAAGYGILVESALTVADTIPYLAVNIVSDDYGKALEYGGLKLGSEPYTGTLDQYRVVIERGVLGQASTLPTELWVGGVNLMAGGTVAGATYDAATNTLTLQNAEIIETNDKSAGIYVDGDLVITLIGENKIEGSESYGIHVAVGGSLTLQGTGTLEITARNYGIWTSDALTVADTIPRVTLKATRDTGRAISCGSLVLGQDVYTGAVDQAQVQIEYGALSQKSNPVGELWVNGENLLDGGTVDGVTYDAETNTLTLRNATLTQTYAIGGDEALIYARGSLNVELIGTNTLSQEGSEGQSVYGIYLNGNNTNLALGGNGLLEISLSGSGFGYAVFNIDGTTYIQDTCKVVIERHLRGYDVYGGGLVIDGGTVKTESQGTGDTSIRILSGLVVKDGVLDVSAYNGSTAVICDNVEVVGGTLRVYSTDACVYTYNLTLAGGTFEALSLSNSLFDQEERTTFNLTGGTWKIPDGAYVELLADTVDGAGCVFENNGLLALIADQGEELDLSVTGQGLVIQGAGSDPIVYDHSVQSLPTIPELDVLVGTPASGTGYTWQEENGVWVLTLDGVVVAGYVMVDCTTQEAPVEIYVANDSLVQGYVLVAGASYDGSVENEVDVTLSGKTLAVLGWLGLYGKEGSVLTVAEGAQAFCYGGTLLGIQYELNSKNGRLAVDGKLVVHDVYDYNYFEPGIQAGSLQVGSQGMVTVYDEQGIYLTGEGEDCTNALVMEPGGTLYAMSAGNPILVGPVGADEVPEEVIVLPAGYLPKDQVAQRMVVSYQDSAVHFVTIAPLGAELEFNDEWLYGGMPYLLLCDPADRPVLEPGEEPGTDPEEPDTDPEEPDSPGTNVGGSSSPAETVRIPSFSHGSVEASPARAYQGGVVTLTVTPDEGYALDTLTVTGPDGEELTLTDLGNGKYSFRMPDGSVKVAADFVPTGEPVEEPGLPFTDVEPGSWYEDAVAYVYENGLMAGTSATTFSPGLTTSRAMIVTILWRLEGSPAGSGTADFTDVAASDYFAQAVAWAAQAGITSGYGDGTFGSDRDITREELAAMLYRYAAYKGYDVSTAAGLSAYTDVADVSTYAAEAMAWAVGEGIISGKTSTTLLPQGPALRSEAAAMVMRFARNVTQD